MVGLALAAFGFLPPIFVAAAKDLFGENTQIADGNMPKEYMKKQIDQ